MAGKDQRLISLTIKERRLALAALDSGLWWSSSMIVLTQANISLARSFALATASAVAALAVGTAASVYRPRWRVGHFNHTAASALAGLVTGVGLVAALAIAGIDRPVMNGMTATMLAIALGAMIRGGWRAAIDRRSRTESPNGTPVIVFGAGDGGRQIIEALARDPHSEIAPVAVLDDDRNLHGQEIAGLIVAGGRHEISRLAERTHAEMLLVAIPSADSALLGDLERLAAASDLAVSVLPPMSQIVHDTIRPRDIRALTPADLLGRKPVNMDLPVIGSYVTGRTVLVTGAGGSIGSELCRQLNRLGPKHLVMLDRDESALHALQLSIDGKGQLDTEALVVADIRDLERLDTIFARWKPDVVFHAAALKHLPLLEMHPDEGMKTNVTGSHNLLTLAAEHGVHRFVNVSTDKAADPTSVLGWTKHLAERLTTRVGLDADLPYSSVRFGNVLGSRGSVLTAFMRQIDEGGPVTVTHPEITRYFMTVEEASSLVIAAGANAGTGDVMILDMGEPVSILDVARDLIKRSGNDIDIEFTGLRPGEKIHEVLQGGDEVIVRTDDELMWRGASEPIDWSAVEPLTTIDDPDDLIRELERLGGCGNKSTGPDILLSPPEVGDEERTMLTAALESGWIAPAGPDLDGFERDLRTFVGSEGALALNSGTGGLHLALRVLGVDAGDEVVVQTTTFAASAFAVRHAGAEPIFIDVDEATGMMDPDLLQTFLTERAAVGRLPKVVMPVDLYGRCADYARINAVCAPYGIAVLQDSAEALGAVSQGQNAGTHGDLAVVSFNGNKIITTSGGGALLGPVDLLNKARKLASQAKEPLPYYEHLEVGFNYRMSNILAALGRAQLRDLPRRIDRRRDIADRYANDLPELEWFPDGVTESPNHWLTVASLPDGVDAGTTVDALLDKGIEARRAWKPMHLQPVFAESESIGGAVAERFFERGLCLPSAQTLQPHELDRVIDALSLAVVETARLRAAT